MSLKKSDQKKLFQVARQSIQNGLHKRAPFQPVNDYSVALKNHQATFVTLYKNGKLRGCIGSLLPFRPLIIDVTENAFAAAFRDPRFNPVTEEEVNQLELSISLLSPPEPIFFTSEENLLTKLRPGTDGLTLKDGIFCGTFLPAVWKELPTPHDFLTHLKLKAGLSPDYWSNSIKMERYTVELLKEK